MFPQPPDYQGSETEGVEKRDPGKAKKYRKLCDSGAIPQHIVDLIDVQSKKAHNPRAEKTALINGLFIKDDKGQYKMQPNQPKFENAREAYSKKYGKEESSGCPRAVMLWQVFQGNEVALNSAIADGSVQEYDCDGVPYCAFRKTKAGTEKANLSTQKMSAGEVDISKEQYHTLTKAFQSMAWTFGSKQDCIESGEPHVGNKSNSSKALEDVGLTEEMSKLVAEAKGAHERLLGTALKLLNKCSNDQDRKRFKQTILKIRGWVNANDNLLMWKEFEDDTPLTPSNFQKYMDSQANETRSINEEVEQFKALLRTRKEL